MSDCSIGKYAAQQNHIDLFILPGGIKHLLFTPACDSILHLVAAFLPQIQLNDSVRLMSTLTPDQR